MESKKKIFAAALMLSVVTIGTSFADESIASSAKRWFANWKNGLSQSAVGGKYQKRSATSVAAVRGSKQTSDDPNKPYWKGSVGSKQARRLREEKAELAAAVDAILEGKLEDGRKKLDSFESRYPQSTLMGDVREARTHLAALAAAPASAETKP